MNPVHITGPYYPDVAVDTDVNWTDVDDARLEDGQTALDGNVGPGGGGHDAFPLEVSDFDFNIPANAIINGIMLEAKVSGTAGGDRQIYLTYDGGTTGANSNTPDFGQAWPGSLTWLTWGGGDQLWGREWTPAEINDPAFGAGLCAFPPSSTHTFQIDSVRITVYWTYSVDVAPADVPTRTDYKMFDFRGTYLGNLPDVRSKYAVSQDINSVGSQITVEAGMSASDQPSQIGLGSINRWLDGWGRRKKLTIPMESVESYLSGFPVYVDLADMGDEFFSKVDSAGDDIRITDRYGNEVPFDLVSIDTSGKDGELYFRSNLFQSDNNVFYIYYDNASASAYAATDPLGSQAVWTDYEGVWHLGDGTTLNTDDSSPNGNDATNTGVVAHAGKLYGGASSQDSSDLLDLATNIDLAGGDYTISTWFIKGPANGAWNTLTRGSATDHQVIIDRGGAGSGDTGNIGVFTGAGWNSSGYSVHSLASGLHHLLAVTSGTSTKFYIDGVLRGTSTVRSTANIGYMANFQSGGQAWGVMDEMRVTYLERTEAWAVTEYNNQNDASSFYIVGESEIPPTDEPDVLVRNGNLMQVWETNYYYPNGKLMFTGQVNKVESEIGDSAADTVKILVHSDGRDMDNLVARGAPFTYDVDQSQTTQNTRMSIITLGDKGGGLTAAGQTFIPDDSNVGRIRLLLDGIATVTVAVYNNAGRSVLLGSTTQAVNVYGPTPVDFIFGSFIPTTPGDDYFFTVTCSPGSSIWLHFADGTNPYADGEMHVASYGGAGPLTFSPETGDDLYFTVYSGTPSTTATYSTEDPSTGMLVPIVEDYNLRGGMITVTDDSVEATGLSLTYQFNTATVFDALKKVLEMAPNGFYYYVDLGTRVLNFKRTSITPDVLLVKGKHINKLTFSSSIENIVNSMLFSGGDTGGGDNLYSAYESAPSQEMYGVRLKRKSDNRVTVQGTADAMSTSEILQKEDEQYATVVTIPATIMDITLFRPGMTVGFRGYGNFIDSIVLQIMRYDYATDSIQLGLGTLPVRFDSRVEETVRGLIAEQTVNNPATPS